MPKVVIEVDASIAEIEHVVKKTNFQNWLCRLFGCSETKTRTVRFGWSVGQPKPKEKEIKMPLEIRITNEQQVNVTLKPVTATGKPAKLDGSPSWTVISGSSQVKVADDGLSADLISSDDPGDTEVMVKADADLGEGVEEISDVVRLSVIGANAANLGLVAGTPTPKP